MSESLKKLKEIPVVNKVMLEIDRALGVKDKVLAEFVLDVAKKSTSVSHFEKQLNEYEAEFSIELVNTIFAAVTRMLPEHFKNVTREEPDNVEDHFNKTRMLEDEPAGPLHVAMHHTSKKVTEEEKFENSEAFDRNFLT